MSASAREQQRGQEKRFLNKENVWKIKKHDQNKKTFFTSMI